MEQNKMQYNANIYGDNIVTECEGWLKTLSKEEEIFITTKMEKEPWLTKKELKSYLMFEKEDAELCGYDSFEAYLADRIFYRDFEMSEVCKQDRIKSAFYDQSSLADVFPLDILPANIDTSLADVFPLDILQTNTDTSLADIFMDK